MSQDRTIVLYSLGDRVRLCLKKKKSCKQEHLAFVEGPAVTFKKSWTQMQRGQGEHTRAWVSVGLCRRAN